MIKSLKINWILFFLLSLSSLQLVGQDLDNGKTLFREYCKQCHNENMKSDLTGPALGGAQDRWEDQEELYSWIKNSQALIKAGNPRANELWNEWGSVMTAFPQLNDEQIGNILGYIDCKVNGTCPGGIPNGPDKNNVVEKGSNKLLYYILFGILGILALVLARIISNLKYLVAAKDGDEGSVERKTLWDILTSKGVIGCGIFALVVIGGYTTVNNAIALNRQQGYAPQQPIAFSHKTHAGINKIDCQYCHDGARRSKHSVIPATNTCMNCHKAIKNGSEHGTAELTKVFVSAGFDPRKGKDVYIDDYDNMSQEDIAVIYKEWIAEQYLFDNDLTEIDREGKRVVKEQWENIVSSLTGPMKEKLQGPIEWNKIHNLPDHVYFNHAQHVSVGQLECQECHGKVEEMAIVSQHSPLSMGWCINCHRETEVKFADNAYYDSYAKYHDEIKSKDRKGVTVEDIGGLECQKCHY